MIGRIAQSQTFSARRARSIPGKGPKAALIQAGQAQKELAEIRKAMKSNKTAPKFTFSK